MGSPLPFAVATGALLLVAASTAEGSGVPPCMAVRSNVVATRVGYNHVVTLTNGCSVAMHCQVSTDVAPEILPVDLGPGERAERTTFRGSPARTFVPHVDCAPQ